MTPTTSNTKWSQRMQGVALAVMLTSTSITPSEASLNYLSLYLTKDSVITNSSVSKVEHLIGEAKSWEEMRILHIRSLRGKYKNKLTSSEEFARKKTYEILLEG